MEAVSTSEKSVNLNVTTRRYILEDSKLHIRRRENLKSHIKYLSSTNLSGSETTPAIQHKQTCQLIKWQIWF
jgi:hypothetical protein